MSRIGIAKNIMISTNVADVADKEGVSRMRFFYPRHEFAFDVMTLSGSVADRARFSPPGPEGVYPMADHGACDQLLWSLSFFRPVPRIRRPRVVKTRATVGRAGMMSLTGLMTMDTVVKTSKLIVISNIFNDIQLLYNHLGLCTI